jgi:poly-gamma-glutamate capsule biosynthesis protein CapA/YwtB (metallophosphatase superfamily)
MKQLLVGDVMLGRFVNAVLQHIPPSFPWGDTLPRILGADWRACNLECVISDRRPAVLPAKAFHFRSDARNVAVLQAAHIDAVSIANNHVLDFGPEAMLDMLDILDQAGIAHAGAGRDLEEARRPAVKTAADGTRIGFVACTDNEPGWEAGENRPGVFHIVADPCDERAIALLGLIRDGRPRVDCLVASLHWGPNWGHEPPRGHRPLARAVIDAGADVVFGHSCHAFRGIEIYRERPIIYCAGDFIDDYAVDPIERNDQSFLYTIDVEEGRPRRISLEPTMIKGFRARLARNDEAGAILDKMSSLSSPFGSLVRREGLTGEIDITGAAEGPDGRAVL